ncbi:MAG TPA: sulfotransferase [Rhodanobacter sp.]
MSSSPRSAPSSLHSATAPWQASALAGEHVERCLDDAATLGAQPALEALCTRLRTAAAVVWVDCARLLLQREQPALAAALLDRAAGAGLVAAHARYWSAQALWQAGQVERAEAQLREMLAAAVDIDAAVLLAKVLRAQGRFNAAAAAMQLCADAPGADRAQLMRSAQFMRECQHQDAALLLCDAALSKHDDDPALHALAGNLAQELGRFGEAERHYRAALAQGVDLNAWFVLHSLAALKRYRDPDDADFGLLRAYADNPTLTPVARAAVLFGLGKASDDVGDYAAAVAAWRRANTLRRASSPWSRTGWDAWVAARLVAPLLPMFDAPDRSVCPIFVVGLPRTGTTLVARWLGQHPQVCNRGELPTLPYLAERLTTVDAAQRPSAVREAAAIYLAHVRRDDPPVRGYVDKNPLNWRYLDAVAAMFPHAHIVVCSRRRRDTALSIWGQSFAHADYAFAAEFADIAAFAAGHDRLLAHWRATLPLAIHTVDYEQLVRDPRGATDTLFAQLGLDPLESDPAASDPTGVITSASQWQARQPVHTRSVDRWRHYAPYLPELERLFPQ